jgi:hypothetical protein
MSIGNIARRMVIPAILTVVAVGYWRLHPHAPTFIAVGYVADRNVVLWNTLAQVRQPVENLHYGDRVEVVRQEGTAAQVRTASGTVGWLADTRQMMDQALREQSASLLAKARTMPVQAQGQTKAASNVRAEPGRNGRRLFQFMRGTPVVVLERTVADASAANEKTPSDAKLPSGEAQQTKKEDWLFVMRDETRSTTSQTSSAGISALAPEAPNGAPRQSVPPVESLSAPPIAGWVLAQFIEYDLPVPMRDYATSAGLHIVAWFELNHVPDGSGGEAPQYLVAASRSGQGQPCDFTMLRVYTWGSVRQRYETAYVESDLCGRLPIRVPPASNGAQFYFVETGDNAGNRHYVMQQTTVRRMRDGPSRRH